MTSPLRPIPERRSITRRTLLRGAAAAAVVSATARSYAQVIGANEDIRIAVAGCGPMGQVQIGEFRRMQGVRLVGICDPDQAILDRISAGGRRGQPLDAKQYRDVRKIIESKEIDALAIASQNHWHSLMTIWACQAGKDVYVEKPVCHSIWEGAQAIAASRKYNRIVQAGTQWRSRAPVYEAFEWIKAGNLGKVQVSRAICYRRRESLGKTDGPQPIPATVDYDLYCGPASNAPPRRTRFHYDWHWFWETGNGDIGNVCSHHIDLARWVLGKPTVAPSVTAVGGRLGYVDDGQTPNTIFAVHDYGDSLLIAEVRGLPTRAEAGQQMDQYKGISLGNVVECENGYVTITEQRCTAFDREGKEIRQFSGDDVERERNHMANFVRAVRSRKREDQNAELIDGTVSANVSHLSNISYRLGQPAGPRAVMAAIEKHPAAVETYNRVKDHLAANNIAAETLTLGASLQVDPQTSAVLNNPAAAPLMTDTYRPPFVVPAIG